MNESSTVSALWWVLVGVSLPLGSANRKLISLINDSWVGPVASWTVEDVSRSCEKAE